MRPGGDLGLAPGKQNVGMVALCFGEVSDLIHESERLLEIRKCERARDMVPVHHLPIRHFLRQRVEFCPGERRNPSPARNAILNGKLGHEIHPPFVQRKHYSKIVPEGFDRAVVAC